VNWTHAGSDDEISRRDVQGPPFVWSMRKDDAMEQAMPSQSGVFVDWMSVDFVTANAGDLPTELASLDPVSPLLDRGFFMQLHGPSLMPEFNGQDQSIFLFDVITSISLVPEPSAVALAAMGMLWLAGLRIWRRSRWTIGVMLLAIAWTLTGARPALAEFKTYAFSGTYANTGGAPLTDLLPGLAPGDPFSGTVSFDASVADGHPLGISLLFDNTYEVQWTTPASNSDYISFAGIPAPNGDIFAATFYKIGGAPEPAFSSAPDVFLSWVWIDLLAPDGSTLPTSAADFDPASPIFTGKYLSLEAHGPDPLFQGMDTTVTEHSLVIDAFTAVPEPSTLVLATGGMLVLGGICRRHQLRARQSILVR
jgi:hypothetical protein